MKLVMVRAYTCGLIIGIHLVCWWRDMVIELYMILIVGWMLGWIQLFEMVIGAENLFALILL
jgi:hypothetical protein